MIIFSIKDENDHWTETKESPMSNVLRIPLTLDFPRTVFSSGTFPCFLDASAFKHSAALENKME